MAAKRKKKKQHSNEQERRLREARLRRLREAALDESYLEYRAGSAEYERSLKPRKARGLRGLAGSPEEHRERAAYQLELLSRDRVERMTCGEVAMALFDAGSIVAHANAAYDGSDTGRKLFTMAVARRDQVFAKAAACGMHGGSQRGR